MSLFPLGLLSQGGGASAGSFELIATFIATGGETQVTFDSIAQTYKHLQLRTVGRVSTTGIGQSASWYVRFNNDSGSNYGRHQLYGNGSSVASWANTPSALVDIGQFSAGDAGANIFGAGIFDVLDYTNTNKYKTTRSLSGATVGARIALESGHWRSTSAVTRLDVVNTGSIATGSRFSLYGIKG